MLRESHFKINLGRRVTERGGETLEVFRLGIPKRSRGRGTDADPFTQKLCLRWGREKMQGTEPEGCQLGAGDGAGDKMQPPVEAEDGQRQEGG